jgi:hypothetical protein
MPDTTPPDRTPDRISPGKPLEADKPLSQPPSTFESYMQGAGPETRSPAASPTAGGSPLAAMQPGTGAPGAPTLDSLLSQARSAQDSLGTVEQQLQTPNLKLKRSQTHLLKNKLQDSNEYLRSASAKLGIESSPLQLPSGASPIGRFLAYINDGQDQLDSVQQKLKELAASKNDIRPAEMLFIQVKMSQAQQEIEYSSTLLSKVIDSIKTIMNTQL